MKTWNKPELTNLSVTETKDTNPTFWNPLIGACKNPAGAGNDCPLTWERDCKYYELLSLDLCTGYGKCTKKIQPTPPDPQIPTS